MEFSANHLIRFDETGENVLLIDCMYVCMFKLIIIYLIYDNCNLRSDFGPHGFLLKAQSPRHRLARILSTLFPTALSLVETLTNSQANQ